MHWAMCVVLLIRINQLLQAVAAQGTNISNTTTAAPVTASDLAPVLVPCLIGGAVVIAIVIIVMIIKIRESRQLEGTYSPRNTEPTGMQVEMECSIEKPSPPERLI